MHPMTYPVAALGMFRLTESRFLYGAALKDIQDMETSITTHGLLNPVIVTRRTNHLVVVDGRTRIQTLRRMKSAGTLPRNLVNIPYVFVKDTHLFPLPALALLSNRDQFLHIGRLHTSGYSLTHIAHKLHISTRHVRDILSVVKLSSKLQKSFMDGMISLEQARAFATLPTHDAQDALMQALGPFASAPEIIDAIYIGETVLSIDEDNVIILPSRTPVPAFKQVA